MLYIIVLKLFANSKYRYLDNIQAPSQCFLASIPVAVYCLLFAGASYVARESYLPLLRPLARNLLQLALIPAA